MYTKEIFPENIKHVRHTEQNIKLLSKKYNTPLKYDGFQLLITKIFRGFEGYIEINIDNGEWSYTPDFVWLYRYPPPLFEVSEL